MITEKSGPKQASEKQIALIHELLETKYINKEVLDWFMSNEKLTLQKIKNGKYKRTTATKVIEHLLLHPTPEYIAKKEKNYEKLRLLIEWGTEKGVPGLYVKMRKSVVIDKIINFGLTVPEELI